MAFSLKKVEPKPEPKPLSEGSSGSHYWLDYFDREGTINRNGWAYRPRDDQRGWIGWNGREIAYSLTQADLERAIEING